MHLLQSTLFILSTIEQVANKLYVNWLNIRPIGLDYKNSDLYKKSFKFNEEEDYFYFDKFKKKNIMNWWKINKIYSNSINLDDIINMYYDGIYIGDIYDTIVNDYYLSIKK